MVVLTSVNLNTQSSSNRPSARYPEQSKPPTRKRITAKLRPQIVEYYEQGNVSALQTAGQFGIGKSTVLRVLKQEGVQVRKHGQRIN